MNRPKNVIFEPVFLYLLLIHLKVLFVAFEGPDN